MWRGLRQVDGDAECLRICIAELLDLPLAAVPRFGHRDGGMAGAGRQSDDLEEWLGYFGLNRRVHHRLGQAKQPHEKGWGADGWRPDPRRQYIAIGPSPRYADTDHAILYREDLHQGLDHDPFPDGPGLPVITEVWELVVVTPWKLHRLSTLWDSPPHGVTPKPRGRKGKAK